MPENETDGRPRCSVRLTIGILAALVAGFWLILRLMGRVWVSDSGLGVWTGAWTHQTSQWVADPYTFSHVLHGIFFCWMLCPRGGGWASRRVFWWPAWSRRVGRFWRIRRRSYRSLSGGHRLARLLRRQHLEFDLRPGGGDDRVLDRYAGRLEMGIGIRGRGRAGVGCSSFATI